MLLIANASSRFYPGCLFTACKPWQPWKLNGAACAAVVSASSTNRRSKKLLSYCDCRSCLLRWSQSIRWVSFFAASKGPIQARWVPTIGTTRAVSSHLSKQARCAVTEPRARRSNHLLEIVRSNLVFENHIWQAATSIWVSHLLGLFGIEALTTFCWASFGNQVQCRLCEKSWFFPVLFFVLT